MGKHSPGEIASAYDSWSERYDAQENATRDLDGVVLRRLLIDTSGLTVVECGCGTGKNSAWLAPRCARLIGIDFSMGMLRLAAGKANQPAALFLLADITHPWPLADASADVVLFNLVLEHVEDLSPVFAQAARVLRRGGQMLLSEYHPTRVSQGKGPVVLASDGTVSQRIPNYLHTLDDYLAAARSANLGTVSVAEWGEDEIERSNLRRQEDPDPRPQLISIVFERSSKPDLQSGRPPPGFGPRGDLENGGFRAPIEKEDCP